MPIAVPTRPGHPDRSPVGARARNRRRILAAVTEFIDVNGIEAASMRQVAEVAGVSVRTLYNQFGDKQGLLRAIVHESLAAIDLAIDRIDASDPVERTWQVVEVAFRTVTTSLSRAVLAPVLTDDELLWELARRWQVRRLMIDEVARAQHAGRLLDDVSADVVVDQAGPTLLYLLRRWAAGAIDDGRLVLGALHAVDLALLTVAPAPQRTRVLEHLRTLG